MSGLEQYRGYRVRIDVCCNDPDNGLFDHRAAAIQLQGDLLELAASDFRGPTFREFPDHIKLSRRRFPTLATKVWLGNWCWNGYWMDAVDAVELLSYAHAIGAFDVEQGEERLFARWRWQEVLTESDREFLARQMVKARLAA
jgi:hypothetical protein